MGRVIWICSVVMGVLLLAMTGGLGALRASSEPSSTVLTVKESDDGTQYYALLHLETGRFIQLTSAYDRVTLIGTSPDGHWLYFVETKWRERLYQGELYGRLRRVSLIPHALRDELLFERINFSGAKFSPDYQWMLYNDDVTGHLIAANLSTGKQVNLNHKLPVGQKAYSRYSCIFDGEWMLFSARDWIADVNIQYRTRLDDSPLEYMGTSDRLTIGHNKPQNGKWYVGYSGPGNQYYGVRDDFQQHFLIEFPQFVDYITFDSWISDEIVLFYGYRATDLRTLFAVRLSDGQIVWTFEKVAQYWYSPENNRMFVLFVDFVFQRSIVMAISPDGTERHFVPIPRGEEMFTELNVWEWAPENEWWYYAINNYYTDRYELHRLSADWKTEELLWTDKHPLKIVGQQGQRLFFAAITASRTHELTDFYQLDTDALDVKRIIQPSLPTWMVDINGPNIEREFQPISLMVVGGGLMGALLWVRVAKKYRQS
ncbi:MAG: hypothetical protein K8L91_28630 [Anaerolineae bacterium]|nr:hypothetical protein [Anaerolineae bacterium]